MDGWMDGWKKSPSLTEETWTGWYFHQRSCLENAVSFMDLGLARVGQKYLNSEPTTKNW